MKKPSKKLKPLTAGRVARRLLAFYDNKPERWAQGGFARDIHGVFVNSHNPTAVCWCAGGAIQKIIPHSSLIYTSRVLEAFDVLTHHLGHPLGNWNDTRKNFNEFKTKLHEIARQP